MNKESLDKMNRMRLLGMHHAFATVIETQQMETFTNDELVHHLINNEWDDRQYRSLQRGLKNANFRYKASIEQLDYTQERGLDKNMVQRLSQYSGKNLSSQSWPIGVNSAEVQGLVINTFYFSATQV